MAKKYLAFIMVITLVLSGILYVFAEGTLPTFLEKPQDITIRSEGASQFNLRWTNPENIIKIVKDIEDGEYDAHLSYLVDWKKNDGNWNIAIPSSHPSWDGNIHGYFSGNMPNVMTDERNAAETIIIIVRRATIRFISGPARITAALISKGFLLKALSSSDDSSSPSIFTKPPRGIALTE